MKVEPLFCIRMVLDDSVLREYAARNLQADSDGFKRMKFKMAGFLIALLVIGILTRDPGRTLLTGEEAALAEGATGGIRASGKLDETASGPRRTGIRNGLLLLGTRDDLGK